MIENNLIKIENNNSGGSFWDNIRIFFTEKNKKTLSKKDLRILFIDDNNFPIVDILNKAGYTCKKIKDIINIEIDEIINSHIIFVDYSGVGKKLSKEEGLGVSKMLVKKYSDSKYIVLYSVQSSLPNEIAMQINKPETAHMCLDKNSEAKEYIEIIEKARKTIKI